MLGKLCWCNVWRWVLCLLVLVSLFAVLALLLGCWPQFAGWLNAAFDTRFSRDYNDLQALVELCAFTAIAAGLFFQNSQLKIQSDALKVQSDALKVQIDSVEEHRKYQEQQSAESVLFRLLAIRLDIVAQTQKNKFAAVGPMGFKDQVDALTGLAKDGTAFDKNFPTYRTWFGHYLMVLDATLETALGTIDEARFIRLVTSTLSDAEYKLVKLYCRYRSDEFSKRVTESGLLKKWEDANPSSPQQT